MESYSANAIKDADNSTNLSSANGDRPYDVLQEDGLPQVDSNSKEDKLKTRLSVSPPSMDLDEKEQLASCMKEESNIPVLGSLTTSPVLPVVEQEGKSSSQDEETVLSSLNAVAREVSDEVGKEVLVITAKSPKEEWSSGPLLKEASTLGGCKEDGEAFTTFCELPKEDSNTGPALLLSCKQEDVETPVQSPSPSPSKRGEIDTTLPYEHVKEAVTLFGGKADLQALKIKSAEKRLAVEKQHRHAIVELEKLKEQLAEAEMSKAHALQELMETKNRLEEVTKNYEQSADAPRKSCFQVENAESSWQIELQKVKEQHVIVLADLEAAKNEIDRLKGDIQAYIYAKATASKQAEEAETAAEIALRRLDELVKEKESRMHEADERGSDLASIQVMKIRGEVDHLVTNFGVLNELEGQIFETSRCKELLQKELNETKATNNKLFNEVAEIKAKLQETVAEIQRSKEAESNSLLQAGHSARELEGIKCKLKEAEEEKPALLATIDFLRAELASTKAELAAVKERESNAMTATAVTDAELHRVKEELAHHVANEERLKESLSGLNAALEQVNAECIEAKVVADAANTEIANANLDIDKANAATDIAEKNLLAALEEAKIAEMAEAKALEEIKLLTHRPHSSHMGDAAEDRQIDALNMKLHETEDTAHNRIIAAMTEVDSVKSSERELLKQLELARAEIEASQHAAQQALDRAISAEAAKSAVEGELRRWRGENEQRRKTAQALAAAGAENEQRRKTAQALAAAGAENEQRHKTAQTLAAAAGAENEQHHKTAQAFAAAASSPVQNGTVVSITQKIQHIEKLQHKEKSRHTEKSEHTESLAQVLQIRFPPPIERQQILTEKRKNKIKLFSRLKSLLGGNRKKD